MPVFTSTAVVKGEKYVPTPEQKAAAEARRAAQAAAKAGKQEQVIANTVTKIPLRSHFDRRRVANALIAAGVSGGAGALVHHRKQVAKQADRTNQALGAVSGAAAMDAAYVVGGQTAKARIKIQRARRGLTPAEEKIWADHKAASGLKAGERVSRDTPDSVKHKLYAHYPKTLPSWKAQRALGWKSNNKVYAGALTGAALLGAGIAGRDKVAKGGLGFALAGGLTGSAGLTAAARRKDAGHKDAAREAIAGTAGGWAAQGLYQGAGYAAKHRAQAKHGYGSSGQGKQRYLTDLRDPSKKVFRTRAQTDKRIKMAEKELGHSRGSVEFDRHYPKTLPEWRSHRVLGWTHRGKTGTALGGALTAVGAYGAAEAASSKKHPWQHEKVGKNVVYGYQERRRSPLRTAELGAGVGLGAYGVSHLPVGNQVRRGVRAAEAKGHGREARALVEVGRRTRDVTGQAAARLARIPGMGTALDVIPPKLRPGLALGAGTLLAARAIPTHDERFVATQRGGW